MLHHLLMMGMELISETLVIADANHPENFVANNIC
jgi:hypothetical protein